MKFVNFLINSNLYVALAAVFLTFETQVLLGITPQIHPYLFIIFFATLFVYNLNRFLAVFRNSESLDSYKHSWVKKHLLGFYLLVIMSAVAFICTVFLAKKEVLITLAPIAVLTLFYSTPIFRDNRNIFRFRQIPYLKIFLISCVWSSATIFLPVIHSDHNCRYWDIFSMLSERFFFILAITIPFDIRDIEVDKQAGLKTLATFFNKEKAYFISYLSLVIFFVISFLHYVKNESYFIVIALSISTVITFMCLSDNRIKKLSHYHYGILDGTMLLQGLLVLLFYYFHVYPN